jgi:hypothetical protein
MEGQVTGFGNWREEGSMDAVEWTDRIARTRTRLARLNTLARLNPSADLVAWIEAEERLLTFLLSRPRAELVAA